MRRDRLRISVEARLAARWWARQLVNPPEQHVGDAFVDGVLNTVSGVTAQRLPISIEQVQAFQKSLAVCIQFDGMGHWARGDSSIVTKDYNNDRLLSTASMNACIATEQILPAKTIMWVRPGAVCVRCGYGAPITTWYNPSIGVYPPRTLTYDDAVNDV